MIVLPDCGQAGDRLPAARDKHLRATLNVLQVLAQAIMQGTHTDLIRLRW